jgi:transposase-like protein
MDEDVGTGVGPAERAHDAGGGGPTPERRRRMSARRKQEAVLRLLRGEDLELLSRRLGVTAAELSGWREAFLAGGEASLRSRPADARDDEIGRLKEKVGDLTMANELLEAKIERLETARPLPGRRSRR